MGKSRASRPHATPLPPTLTAGEGYETLGASSGLTSDAEREIAVTNPSFVLRRSPLLGRYGACCL
ncbi:hypothetical protein FAGKG844_150024 [Frankia sp. AgKG'84/4]